jgi:hypothetical protein
VWACAALFPEENQEYVDWVIEEARGKLPHATTTEIKRLVPIRISEEEFGRNRQVSSFNFAKDFEIRRKVELQFLETIAESAKHEELTLRQKRGLDELSTFVEAMASGSLPAPEFPSAWLSSREEAVWLIRFAVSLISIDSGILATEADHALTEMEEENNIFSLLWDEPAPPNWGDWESLKSPKDALGKLVSFFEREEWFVRHGFSFLLDYPDSDELIETLRPVHDKLVGRPRHQAAMLLMIHAPAQSNLSEELLAGSSWADRAAVAIWGVRLDEDDQDQATKVLTRLLNDRDELVRRFAFSYAVGNGLEDRLPAKVEQLSEYKSCYTCGAYNNSASSTCDCSGGVHLETDAEYRERYETPATNILRIERGNGSEE